ncbi:MAG: hypothetical protein WA820_28645 [Bradyrhizobium sp.]
MSSINQFLNGVRNPEMAIVQFLEGATLMKHADFVEEREVRIVAIPGAEGYQKQGTIEKPDYVWNPLPTIRPRPDGTGRRYVNLFEGCDVTLPIKRVCWPVAPASGACRRGARPRRTQSGSSIEAAFIEITLVTTRRPGDCGALDKALRTSCQAFAL